MEVLAKVPQQPWGIQLAMDPPKEPESRFLFVNATNKSRAPNNATARAVRQHVMRDIGRSRRKRRNPQFELELRPAAPPPGPSPQGVQVESSQLAAERPWAFLAGRALDLHSEGAWNMQCEGAESSPTVELPRTKDATQATPPALARPFWDQHPAQMFDDVLPMDPFAAYSLALALSQPPSCLKGERRISNVTT